MRIAIPACLILFFLMTLNSIMNAQTPTNAPRSAAQSGPPTPEEAADFIKNAEVRLDDLAVKASRAAWVQSNFITDDTEKMAAEANEVLHRRHHRPCQAVYALRQAEAARPSYRARCSC